MKLFIILNLFFIYLNAYEKTIDSKNVYYSSTHFRAVFGVSYENSVSTVALAKTYLDIAEETWSREIDELDFKRPRNTDIKKIDIYLGNKSAYNAETQSYENISPDYAGWATSYPSDDTPYFLLNTNIPTDILKVTIAHEFFHTIQYAYFDEALISDNKWFKNIWWLEATAVLMEDEVYDSLDDYIVFLSPFFEASHQSFEIYDGSHEYAMVIFAKYIKEKFGMQLINDSLARLDKSSESDGYFEILDTLLRENYNSSMQLAVNEFAKWVSKSELYFEEGNLYPSLKHYPQEDIVSIEKGGVKVIDHLDAGWNMVALSSSNIDSLNIENLQSVWSYENAQWSSTQYNDINTTDSSRGYWVQTNASSSLYYTSFDKSENSIQELGDEWNLLGTLETLFVSSFDAHNVLVWQFKDGEWFVYSNDAGLREKIKELEYKTLNSVLAYSSYWIKKI